MQSEIYELLIKDTVNWLASLLQTRHITCHILILHSKYNIIKYVFLELTVDIIP